MLSFKQFIQESPYVMPKFRLEKFRETTEELSKYFRENHKNSEKLFDTDIGAVHRIKSGPANLYYHYVNNKPRENSIIFQDNDIQRRIDKNGGDGKYIAQMTKHHAKEFGRVRSDDIQSIGGMKYWKKLYHEKDPNFTFHHEMNSGSGEHPKYKENVIDDEYMKNNENNIWSNNKEDGQRQRVVIRRK